MRHFFWEHKFKVDWTEWSRYANGTPFTRYQAICSCKKTKVRKKNGLWRKDEIRV